MDTTKLLVGTLVAVAGGAIIGASTDNFGMGILSALFIGGGFYMGSAL